jgi:hypothetical protein
MRWINTKAAIDLQVRYLGGDRGALDGLYVELLKIAEAILTDSRVQGSISELSHDAATNMIMCYVKNPKYQIHNGNFLNRMMMECRQVSMQDGLGPSGIHKDRPITKNRKAEVSYEQIYDNEIVLARADSDDGTIASQAPPVPLGGGVATMPVANFLYAGEEDPQLLNGLVAYFAHYKWFRPAIKVLATYVPKRFLLDHAVEIHRIYLEARRAKDSTQSPNRRRREKQSKRASTLV